MEKQTQKIDISDIELFSKSVRVEQGIENNLHAPKELKFNHDRFII